MSPANWLALNEFMTMSPAVNLDCPALAITLNAKDANFSQPVTSCISQSRSGAAGWWVPQWHKPVYEHVIRRLAAADTPFGPAPGLCERERC